MDRVDPPAGRLSVVAGADRGPDRPLLEQAIAIYERLDAGRDLARANAVLRLAGVQRGVRGPRQRPQFGWRSLTPTERTVAALVADGLSNPQIGEQGRSLLCNGVVLFDDGGELLPMSSGVTATAAAA